MLRNRLKKYPGILPVHSKPEPTQARSLQRATNQQASKPPLSTSQQNQSIASWRSSSRKSRAAVELKKPDAQDPDLQLLNIKLYSSDMLASLDQNQRVKVVLEDRNFRLRTIVRRVLDKYRDLVASGVEPEEVR